MKTESIWFGSGFGDWLNQTEPLFEKPTRTNFKKSKQTNFNYYKDYSFTFNNK